MRDLRTKTEASPCAAARRRDIMIRWALMFLVVAIVAGVFGFGIIASAFAGVAQIVFFLFVALFVISLFFRSVPTPPAT